MAACRTLLPTSSSPLPPVGSNMHRYSCKSYTNKLLVNLNDLWLSEYLCDVELSAGDYSVKAHRVVLSAASAYFQAMFTTGLCEEKQANVELKSLSPSSLSKIVNFIYTGDIEITVDNVQDIIVAADMLQLSEIVLVCTNFLKRELQPSNVIGIFRFADAHNLKEIQDITRNYIFFNFIEISSEDEFLECPLNVFTEFIQSEYLRIDTEFQVFLAAMSWIRKDIKTRRRHVFEILSHLRLPLVPIRSLEKYLNDCSDTSLKVALRSIQKDLESKKGSLVALSVLPRLCSRKKIFVIGGSKRELISNWTRFECTYESVECFDTFRNEWQKVQPMGIGRILPGVAVFNGKIYVVGGEQESRILANGEYYDPEEDTWSQIAPMVIPRCEFGLCTFNDSLFAFGGWIGEDIGGSIEKYNPTADEWSVVDEMPEGRFSMGVVEHKGLIYIVGGCMHSKRHLQDLLCYNPVTKEWTQMAPMLTSRSQMGVVVLDEFLYVVGGTNRHCEVLNSVEKYSFLDDKWYKCQHMTVGRASPSVATTNSKLYAIGGYETSHCNDFYRAQVTIANVECYDPETDAWETCTPLPETRSEAGAVTI